MALAESCATHGNVDDEFLDNVDDVAKTTTCSDIQDHNDLLKQQKDDSDKDKKSKDGSSGSSNDNDNNNDNDNDNLGPGTTGGIAPLPPIVVLPHEGPADNGGGTKGGSHDNLGQPAQEPPKQEPEDGDHRDDKDGGDKKTKSKD